MTLGSSATLSLGLLPLMATSLTLSTLSGPLRPEPVGTDVPARWPGPCAPGGRWYTSAPTTAAPPAAKATTAKLTSRRGRLAAGRYRPGRRFTRGHATASPPMPAAVPKPPPEGTSVAARLLEPWPTSRVAGSGADRSTPVLVPGPGPRRCGARCGPRSTNAPAGFFLQQLAHQDRKLSRDLGAGIGEPRDRLLHMGEGSSHVGRGTERRFPRQHLEHHDTERVKVGACVWLLTPHLFRRHVLRGAKERALGCEVARGCGRLGNTEVRHLHLGQARALVAQQHVRWLDVAVHKAQRVRVGERVGHL